MASIDLTGIAEMTQALTRLTTAPLPALQAQLGEEAKEILQVSAQLCPYLTGALVRSGEIEGPEVRGTVVEVGIRYGDHGQVPYAAMQEMDVTLNHPRGGQAHFLQQPLFEAPAGLSQRVAAALHRALT